MVYLLGVIPVYRVMNANVNTKLIALQAEQPYYKGVFWHYLNKIVIYFVLRKFVRNRCFDDAGNAQISETGFEIELRNMSS